LIKCRPAADGLGRPGRSGTGLAFVGGVVVGERQRGRDRAVVWTTRVERKNRKEKMNSRTEGEGRMDRVFVVGDAIVLDVERMQDGQTRKTMVGVRCRTESAIRMKGLYIQKERDFILTLDTVWW